MEELIEYAMQLHVTRHKLRMANAPMLIPMI